MNRNPYKVYADFESILVKREQIDTEDKTIILNDHVAVSYCLYFKSYDSKDNKIIKYKGLDCVDNLFEELKKIEKFVIKDIDSNRVPIKMTTEDELNFKSSKVCYLCLQEFNKKFISSQPVRDHDHYTGKYRGAAHGKCNLDFNLRHNYKIPVFFHNLKNYDSHFLISNIHKHIESEKD